VLDDVGKVRSYFGGRVRFGRRGGVDLNREWVGFVGEVSAELAGRRGSFMLGGFGLMNRKFLGEAGSFAEFGRAFSLPRLVLHIKSVIFQIHADVINLSLVLLLFSNFKKITQTIPQLIAKRSVRPPFFPTAVLISLQIFTHLFISSFFQMFPSSYLGIGG